MMATTPMPAAQPDVGDDAGADAGGDAGETGADMDAQPTVILTVLDMGDGTVQLVQGDEAEPGEAGGDAGMGAGAEGETGAGAPQGTSYDSVGKLLKAIMDIVQPVMEGASGENSEASNFKAGFSGGAAAPTQKY